MPAGRPEDFLIQSKEFTPDRGHDAQPCAGDFHRTPRPSTPDNVRTAVNLKDWIKIALAVGLLSLGVQLYAGAVPTDAPAAQPISATPR